MPIEKYQSAPEAVHLVEFQSLRGIAAMVVLFGHCLSVFQIDPTVKELQHVFNTRAAVNLFFILSGYVLTQSILLRGTGYDAIRRFYVARAFRIFPCLWVASTLALVCIWGTGNAPLNPDVASSWFLDRYKAERYNALFIALSYVGVSAFLLPPVWSIAVEMFASALLPMMHRYCNRRALLTVLAISSGYTLLYLPSGPYQVLSYVMDFVLGAVLFAYRHELMRVGSRTTNFKAAATGLVALLLVLRVFFYDAGKLDGVVHVAESLACAILLHLVSSRRLASRPLSHRWLVTVGDYSYGIYLLHFPIMYAFAHLSTATIPNFIAASPALANWALVIITTPITILLAGLSYVHIERRAIDVGKRVASRGTLQTRAVQSS